MRCVQINDAGVVVAAVLWGEAGLPPDGDGYSWRASDEAQPGWSLSGGALVAPPPGPEPAPPPPQGGNVALADLSISGDDIGGIGQAAGVGFAMAVEPNVFWLFFSQPQPDAAYVTFAQATGSAGSKVDADVSDQTTDYVEITVTDRLTAEPAIPSRLALSIMRAQ